MKDLQGSTALPPVFLLAYGVQVRLAPRLPVDQPKQLILINEVEEIVARTTRLLDELVPHGQIYLVAPDTAPWLSFVRDQLKKGHNVDHLYSGLPNGKGVVDTIRGLGGTPGLYLLADVVFSRKAMKIVSDSVVFNQSQFFGRRNASTITGKTHGELFGFYVTKEDIDFVDDATEILKTVPDARLWDLLGTVRSLISAGHENVDVPLTLVDDYTDDIDTLEDIEEILPRLCAFAAADV